MGQNFHPGPGMRGRGRIGQNHKQEEAAAKAERNSSLLRVSYIPINGMFCMQTLPKIDQILNDVSPFLSSFCSCFGKPAQERAGSAGRWARGVSTGLGWAGLGCKKK